MARVQGLKEKLHMPLYDAFFLKEGTFGAALQNVGSALRFFVDVQGKTKLETNLQTAGELPSRNSYVTHALRVVVAFYGEPAFNVPGLREAANAYANSGKGPQDLENLERAVRAALSPVGDPVPFLRHLIYSSVTTLLVGEKNMIEAPSFYFPSGAGIHDGNGGGFNHGEPDPMATFRFSEPVSIEPNQAFRVEMLFPQGLTERLRNMPAPLRIWVTLDGYLTRDVQ